MAVNPYVNKVIVNDNTLIDLTADTVDASHLALGYTAHDCSGKTITGTMVGGVGTYNIDATISGDTQTWAVTDGETYTIVPLTATVNGTYTAPANTAYNPVTVNVPNKVAPINGRCLFRADGDYRNPYSNISLINYFDFTTGSLRNASDMFDSCYVTTLDLSDWDVSNVTDMYMMFRQCYMMTSINLSGWDVSNVSCMDYMFSECAVLTSLDLSSFSPTVPFSASEMFAYCDSLTYLDLSGMDTSLISSTSYMFRDCSAMQTAYCRSQADKEILDAAVQQSGQSWTFIVKE